MSDFGKKIRREIVDPATAMIRSRYYDGIVVSNTNSKSVKCTVEYTDEEGSTTRKSAKIDIVSDMGVQIPKKGDKVFLEKTADTNDLRVTGIAADINAIFGVTKDIYSYNVMDTEIM